MAEHGISDLKPYPNMKDSGVEGLGKVPAHWAIRRLAQIGTISKGGGGNKDDEVSAGIPCIRYGDLYTTHDSFIEKSRSFVSKNKAREYTAIKYGDVLFAGSGETIDEIGKSAVNLMRQDACCGGDVILFRPTQQIEARYLGYALDCRQAAIQKATMGRGITIMHIYGTQMKYLTIPIPPLAEQTAIVRFLDHADRHIQHYIRARQKLIALLAEQKQTIIHQAVTGQIDVRNGRSYSAYKPSGVEWLRTIPKHWSVRRMKSICSRSALYGANVPASLYADAGIRFLRTTDITEDGQLRPEGVFVPGDLVNDYILSDGDLLISRSGTIGRSFIYDSKQHGPCAYAGYLVRFTADKNVVMPRYLFWFTKTRSFDDFLRVKAISSTIENLNGEKYGNCSLPVPSLSEQTAIAHFLDHTERLISHQIAATRSLIALLDEFRTRLIADVIVGKIDVRTESAIACI